MRRHWQYLKYVLRHKWFVFVEGIKIGVPIHLLIFHDISKFRPSEWFAYARTFYSPSGKSQYEPDEGGMDIAWNAHQKRNKHHWQYWLLRNDNPSSKFNCQSYDGGMTHSYIVKGDLQNRNIVAIVYDEDDSLSWHHPENDLIAELEADLKNTSIALPMPNRYRCEMLADWRGAGRALGFPDTRAWYAKNYDNMQLHPETRQFLDVMLKYVPPILKGTYISPEMFKELEKHD